MHEIHQQEIRHDLLSMANDCRNVLKLLEDKKLSTVELMLIQKALGKVADKALQLSQLF